MRGSSDLQKILLFKEFACSKEDGGGVQNTWPGDAITLLFETAPGYQEGKFVMAFNGVLSASSPTVVRGRSFSTVLCRRVDCSFWQGTPQTVSRFVYGKLPFFRWVSKRNHFRWGGAVPRLRHADWIDRSGLKEERHLSKEV